MYLASFQKYINSWAICIELSEGNTKAKDLEVKTKWKILQTFVFLYAYCLAKRHSIYYLHSLRYIGIAYFV